MERRVLSRMVSIVSPWMVGALLMLCYCDAGHSPSVPNTLAIVPSTADELIAAIPSLVQLRFWKQPSCVLTTSTLFHITVPASAGQSAREETLTHMLELYENSGGSWRLNYHVSNGQTAEVKAGQALWVGGQFYRGFASGPLIHRPMEASEKERLLFAHDQTTALLTYLRESLVLSPAKASVYLQHPALEVTLSMREQRPLSSSHSVQALGQKPARIHSLQGRVILDQTTMLPRYLRLDVILSILRTSVDGALGHAELPGDANIHISHEWHAEWSLSPIDIAAPASFQEAPYRTRSKMQDILQFMPRKK